MTKRVTVHHLTRSRCLPLIEEEGLRTRGELASQLGGLDPIDEAARGKYAHGRRVSGWLSLEHALSVAGEYGPGHVTWDVDPARAVAAPASLRAGDDAAAYWEAARPLAAWLADGDVPVDLEVHVDRGVRAKHVRLMAPKVTAEELGIWAPLVEAVADEDRMSAKALMHLAVMASEGDFDGQVFAAACALAWRDEPDEDDLIAELLESDPEKVAAAALAMYGSGAPEASAILREQLEATREFAAQHDVDGTQAVLMRTAMVLEQVDIGEVLDEAKAAVLDD